MVNNSSKLNALHVALDIGTTKVVALAGRVNRHGKLEILGHGKVESTGVLRGIVSNIEKTVQAITQAVQNAEQAAGVSFKEVEVGITGQHIKTIQHNGMITRDNDHTEISEKDIERMINDIYKMVLPAGDRILHVVPQEYMVDAELGIIDPIGMSGIRLDGHFLVITTNGGSVTNTTRCLDRVGLHSSRLVLQAIASAKSVLSEEEREAGVALVDIGGGTTDIIIYKDNIIRHTASLGMGGNLLTADVREGCNIMLPMAEKLKVQYGSALAEEIHDPRIITMPSLAGREPREVNERNLAMIIQARMEEIFEAVYAELHRSGLERKLVAGIVLTGGGSKLRHIDLLCEEVTGIQTRMAKPNEVLSQGYPESVAGPDYSAAIGMLLHAHEESQRKPLVVEAPKVEEAVAPQLAFENNSVTHTDTSKPVGMPSWLEKVRGFFEAEPDKNLD